MNKIIMSIFALVSVLLLTSITNKSINAQELSENNHVPESYIVVFQDNVSNPAEHASEMARQHGLSLAFTYSHALKGFSATIPAARLEKIKSDPSVKFVSQDKYVSIDARPSAKPTPTPVPQPDQIVPFGIQRIGQGTNSGMGIGVAIIDTGIDLTHPDLAANIASENKTCVPRTSTGNDDNGHGTHVAGTIAAVNNDFGVVGVAPGAKLYAVKVLDKRGSGTWSSVICGIDWVTEKAQTLGIKVANMSLGGTGSSDDNCGLDNNDALHQAICDSTKAGVTYVVAAGNENDDAANHVPAAYDDTVITVSALADSDGKSGGFGTATSYGLDDTFATFSNYSPSIVDIGAPGVNILSTWKGGGYNTISGTSMATPHVSGAAAVYLGAYPDSTWIEIRKGLVDNGEALGNGHTDPSYKHLENVLFLGSL